MAPPGKKRHYKPPQADVHTFETQHEFLESLQPVPIETVDENSRKCPHCWKRFGESDPGLDNAEEPVKFRCNHVFGEKCMKSLFGLPEPVRVNLVQLSFESGSKGAELGRRLSAYVDECGVEKGSLLIGGKREKDFSRLLNEMDNPNRAYEILGKEWYSLIQQAMSLRPNLQEIHILENAMIFDIATPEVKEIAPAAPVPMAFPAFTSMDPSLIYTSALPPLVTVADPGPLPGGTSLGQYLYEAAVKAEEETSSSASSSSELDNTNAYSTATPAGLDEGLALAEEALSTAPAMSGKYHTEDSSAGKEEPIPMEVDALLKEAMTEAESQLLAEESKLKETLAQLGDPGLAQYLPSPYASMLFQSGPSPWMEGPASLSAEIDKILDKVADGPSSSSGSQHALGPTKEKEDEKENVPGAWKDVIPKQSNLDKLVALQKKSKKAQEALKAAQKKKQNQLAAQKKYEEVQREQAEKAEEEREARKKEQIVIFVRALAKVYDGYEQYQYDAAIAAGQPPPVKKLKLASGSPKVTPAAAPESHAPNPQNVINVSATVHARDIEAKEYEVPAPYIYPGEFDYDDEYDGPVSDNDGNQASSVSAKPIFLTRTGCSCPKCCKKERAPRRSGFHSIPESVFWKDTKNIPDGCPICQRVLFKKGPKTSKSRGTAVSFGSV